jgi:tRNA-specific 2-thiouridylase
VPSGNHIDVVRSRRPEAAAVGQIVEKDGTVLGAHDGIDRFTIGQRKGLGLATGIPLYVVDIDAAGATVTVGPRDALERDTLIASGVNWIGGETPTSPIRAHARIRYRHHEAAATIAPLGDDRVRVVFDAPQSAITPGQAAVFFEGDVVLGGGWID